MIFHLNVSESGSKSVANLFTINFEDISETASLKLSLRQSSLIIAFAFTSVAKIDSFFAERNSMFC